jgi:hypothetical protein
MIETPPPATATHRPPRMTRGQANLVRAFCLWTAWVWATRIWNIWGDDSRSTGFKVVHTVLAAVSVAFAVAVWFVVRRLRTPVSTSGGDPAGDAG